MIALALAVAALAAEANRARPIEVQWVDNLPETEFDKTGKLFETVAKQYKFGGQYLVARGENSWNVDEIVRDFPRTKADLKAPRNVRLWRWASVTKQVVATLVMQEVAAGHVDLDKPVSTYLPRFAGPNAKSVTVRQLLRHQSGFPNPDDTAVSKDAIPAYDAPNYSGSRDPLTGYCAGPPKRPPGGNWEYNNCDYVVAGALLEAVTGKNWQRLVSERIAKPLGLKTLGAFPTTKAITPGFVAGKPDSGYELSAFGAAAGLYGTITDLLAFDRALMTGKLLPTEARKQMWDGQPKLGSIALGQWVFNAKLEGCAKPVRIVERRGQIGGVQARNFILPDLDIAVIAFANRAEFEFGEVWQGKGFAYDMLSAAACH